MTYTYNANASSGGTISIAGTGTDYHNYNFSNDQLTVTTALGGTFVVNMDALGGTVGDFTYTPSATLSSAVNESFTYTVADSDSSVSNSATLTISIDPAQASTAATQYIVTDQSGYHSAGDVVVTTVSGTTIGNTTTQGANEIYVGGSGNETFNVGGGNNIIIGGGGQDVIHLNLSAAGNPGSPNVNVIADFTATSKSTSTDVL